MFTIVKLAAQRLQHSPSSPWHAGTAKQTRNRKAELGCKTRDLVPAVAPQQSVAPVWALPTPA